MPTKAQPVKPPVLTPAAPAQARTMAFIRKQIDGHGLREGDPLPSENAISRELSVSRGTVRAAFAVLQEQGLIESGQGRVRRVGAIAGGPSVNSLMRKTVIVASAVIDPTRYLHRGWDTHTQNVFSTALRAKGHHVLNLSPSNLSEAGGPEELLDSRPGGLVLCPSVSGTPEGKRLAAAARHRGVRVVAESDDPAYAGCDRVVPDHAAGSQALVRWLADRGRRNILPLFPADLDAWWVAARLEGYARGVAEAGLAPIGAERVPELAELDRLEPAALDHQTRVLMGYLYPHVHGDRPVDAVMAASDRQVPYLAYALQRMGVRVNEDVDLVGYDAVWPDVHERTLSDHGPLATVDKQNQRVGQTIADVLTQPPVPRGEPSVRRIDPCLISLT
ncbi:MAG: GntR family transcriptional regulator [Planctomycetota bacterium]